MFSTFISARVRGMALTASGKTLHGRDRLNATRYCLVLLVIWLSASGCVLNRTTAIHSPDLSSEPSVDETLEKNSDAEAGERDGKNASTGKIEATASEKVGTGKDKKKQDKSDLNRQLRVAANELAAKLGPIKAMKLCYVEKDNEWWVVLFRDIGPVIDVRRFFWNWEEQRFKPFLVVKRIPKNRLRKEVNRKEPGKKCVNLKPPNAKSED
jgi:hypothetical protein